MLALVGLVSELGLGFRVRVRDYVGSYNHPSGHAKDTYNAKRVHWPPTLLSESSVCGVGRHRTLDSLAAVREASVCIVSIQETDSRPALIYTSYISYGYLTLISKSLTLTLTPLNPIP